MISGPPDFAADGLCSQGFDLDGLIRFNAELRERGIDLILLPVPVKGAFASVFFSEKAPADRVVAVNHQWFMQQLLENDIEVIDLLPVFHAAADDSPEKPYIYNFNRDHHWASGGRMAAARALAERLARYDFARQYPPDALTVRTVMGRRDEDNEGKHYVPPGSYLNGREYPVFQVGLAQGKKLPELWCSEDNAAVKGSPILLAGDSMLREGTTGLPGTHFADYLACATGVLPAALQDTLGFGLNFRENLGRSGRLPEILQGRRVFVWVLCLIG